MRLPAFPALHLMVEQACIRTARGPKECRARPAVDILFRSVAVESGPCAAGVVLSDGLGGQALASLSGPARDR